MFNLRLTTLSCLLLVAATTTGCDLTAIQTKLTKSAPEKTVTHLVVREVNPDDLDNDNRSGDQFDVYLTDTAARAEISETITVGDLSPNTTTIYFFSDQTARQEYMFTYPNEVSEADLAALPSDYPLKQGKSVIMSLPIDQRPSGTTDQSLIELILQPILTIPTDQFITSATAPYVITDDYINEFDDNANLERHTTIDPKTNLPTQVQLVDKTTDGSIETFVIDRYDSVTESSLVDNFFTLEGWKQSLPGENHVVVEDDLN